MLYVCFVDDISIPHTWRTVGSPNNRFYIMFKMGYLIGQESAYRWDPFVLTLPEGNDTGSNLASGIQDLLNGFAVTFHFEVIYHAARGTISIEAKSEGMDCHSLFDIPSDFGTMTWESNSYAGNDWKNRGSYSSIRNK